MTFVPYALLVIALASLAHQAFALLRYRNGRQPVSGPRTTRGRVGGELVSAGLLLAVVRVLATTAGVQVLWVVTLAVTAAVLGLAVHRWPHLPATGSARRRVSGVSPPGTG